MPKYSEMYDDIKLFENETEAIFREKSDLEEKLNQLKKVTEKVTELCSQSDVKVSFAVFEAFKELS